METTRPARYDRIRGTIDAVDLVSREVQILTATGRIQLDVPVVCQIIMYDDRVRLRMLQPSDTVEVLFTWEHGQAVAQSIEVRSSWQREATHSLSAAKRLAN